MPRIVGGSERVVDHEGLTIDELAGNVATKNDRISIALVKVANASSEPWLTLAYDEWMCVLKGRMVLLYGEDGKKELEVKAGETVYIESGERFRPMFPDAGTEYVPVCLPAFRPDRCIREESADSEVSQKLAELHGKSTTSKKRSLPADFTPPEVLYHMCEVALWEASKKAGAAYFPPTFEVDGNLTHATGVPSRLIETANHFYTGVKGDWICLRFTRTALRKAGIIVVDEAAAPVGDQAVGDSWGEWICPHLMGGIPEAVVDTVFPMRRTSDGTFVSIEGVTDAAAGAPAADLKKAR